MIYGYARVSSIEQDTQLQLDALQEAGAEHIYHEKTSSVGARPELQKLLKAVKPGETLLVYKLDRLARSLKRKGCKFRSLTEPVQTDNYLGRFMLQILEAVAELERNLIRERSIAGQRAAVEKGARLGRPCTIPNDALPNIKALYWQGVTKSEISRRYGETTSAMKRYFKKYHAEIFSTADP